MDLEKEIEEQQREIEKLKGELKNLRHKKDITRELADVCINIVYRGADGTADMESLPLFNATICSCIFFVIAQYIMFHEYKTVYLVVCTVGFCISLFVAMVNIIKTYCFLKRHYKDRQFEE
jgi:hypothetical protein